MRQEGEVLQRGRRRSQPLGRSKSQLRNVPRQASFAEYSTFHHTYTHKETHLVTRCRVVRGQRQQLHKNALNQRPQ